MWFYYNCLALTRHCCAFRKRFRSWIVRKRIGNAFSINVSAVNSTTCEHTLWSETMSTRFRNVLTVRLNSPQRFCVPKYEWTYCIFPTWIYNYTCVYLLYASYFSDDEQNGTRSSESNGKDNAFEYNFLIICRYLNLFKKIRW
jgi:hypothetical protein